MCNLQSISSSIGARIKKLMKSWRKPCLLSPSMLPSILKSNKGRFIKTKDKKKPALMM
jgi:hypothetical protein